MLPKDKILLRLRSNDNKLIIRALQEVRNYLKKSTITNVSWLVEQLLQLLEKANTTVLDLTLSNLATLLLHQDARNTFRTNNGANKLMKILTILEDISILRRGFRAASNAAIDAKICHALHQHGIASALGHKLKSTTDSQMKIILLRCIRILSDAPQYRNWLDEEGVYEKVGSLLQDAEVVDTDTLLAVTTAPELIKVLLKCVAKLTHNANITQAGKLAPAANILATLCQSPLRDIWEHSLMAIVNISQHASLRPTLGNEGAVKELVDKYNGGELTGRESNQVITALCLYCRESVNRLRLRESGGCVVFVTVLTTPLAKSMHDRVINSLLQFMYDNHSLNVFMSAGLIPSLVAFVEQHLKTIEEKKENEVTKEEPTAEKCEDVEESDASYNKEAAEQINSDENVLEQKSDDAENIPTEPSNESGPGLISTADDSIVVPPSAGQQPVFRINSPSYQAVQYELEQFMQLRQIHSSSDRSPRHSQSGGGGWASPSSRSMSPVGLGSSRSDFIPLSPPSLLQSPDRSPSHLSCGYSPQRSEPSPTRFGTSPGRSNMSPGRSDYEYSPGRSDMSSPEPVSPPPTPGALPVYSPVLPSYSPSRDTALSPAPADPSYSPIETFSDEEDEGPAPEKVKETVKEDVQAENPTPSSSTTQTGSQEEETLLPMNPEQTAVSPTTVLPSAKRPRLCIPPVYKYSASPITSPQVRKPGELVTVREDRGSGSTSETNQEDKPLKSSGGRIDWILDVFSRLTQADRPHEDLTSTRTIHCLFELACKDSNSFPRILKVFTRLSKNLYCLFPFLTHRHPTWFIRKMEEVWCKEEGKDQNTIHQEAVRSGFCQVQRNLTALAETGYGEGEICHRLVNKTFSQEVKFNVAISSAQLVKDRRKLGNILINHESLDMLIDLLEQSSDEDLIEDTVLCLSSVAGHVGIVSPNLTLPPAVIGPCQRESESSDSNDITLEVEDGSKISTSRQLLITSSSVFSAMLEGGFKEAHTSSVIIPGVSLAPLECLVHHLSGCSWCLDFARLSAVELLEMLELSDRYLLPDLNLRISHQIVRGCMLKEGFLLQVYEKSLQKRYPVQCSDESLAECTVSTVLVADMTVQARTRLVNTLVQSTLRADFLDDVNKMIRKKIFAK